MVDRTQRARRLAELTGRWRARHDARRAAAPTREPADPERVERALSGFPFRELSPAQYVARHGAEMSAYTYDDYAYPDADLQAWLDEVGVLLRERRTGARERRTNR